MQTSGSFSNTKCQHEKKRATTYLRPKRKTLLRAKKVTFIYIYVDFCSRTFLQLASMCVPVSFWERGGGLEGEGAGERGPLNSSGSSCIRVNGTNYKSRAISPHYSAGTRRKK